LILVDRLTHPTTSSKSQLWNIPHTNTEDTHQHSTQTWSCMYAMASVVWLALWAGWTIYFAANLQLYEQLKLSMPAMSNTSLILISVTIVMFGVAAGATLAELKSHINHIADIEQKGSPAE